MKEEYFTKVISDISRLCSDFEIKRMKDKDEDDDAVNFDLDDLFNFYSDREEIDNYLEGLTNTTLNTICALMDFGRRHELKVLPINLNDRFNKYYLPYWFEKNEGENKEETVSYLSDKCKVLPRYLHRAKEILFYNKDNNIELIHECGGKLCLDDSYCIEAIDFDEYELHLKCLKCNSEVSKIVDESYLDKRI